jgi:hypothetical protein
MRNSFRLEAKFTDEPHLGLAAASHLAFGLTAAGKRMSAADESLGCEYKKHKMDLNTRNLKCKLPLPPLFRRICT